LCYHSFDLTITGPRVPDVDGIALTEAIRAQNSAVVVIWTTAYGCHTLKAEAADQRNPGDCARGVGDGRKRSQDAVHVF